MVKEKLVIIYVYILFMLMFGDFLKQEFGWGWYNVLEEVVLYWFIWVYVEFFESGLNEIDDQ